MTVRIARLEAAAAEGASEEELGAWEAMGSEARFDRVLYLWYTESIVEVGRMPAVGFKFGSWLDLVFLQRSTVRR